MPLSLCKAVLLVLSLLWIFKINTDTLREEVFKTLSFSDVEALDLVQQCRLLELPYSTNFTSEVLSNSAASLKGLKKRIIEVDRSY